MRWSRSGVKSGFASIRSKMSGAVPCQKECAEGPLRCGEKGPAVLCAGGLLRCASFLVGVLVICRPRHLQGSSNHRDVRQTGAQGRLAARGARQQHHAAPAAAPAAAAAAAHLEVWQLPKRRHNHPAVWSLLAVVLPLACVQAQQAPEETKAMRSWEGNCVRRRRGTRQHAAGPHAARCCARQHGRANRTSRHVGQHKQLPVAGARLPCLTPSHPSLPLPATHTSLVHGAARRAARLSRRPPSCSTLGSPFSAPGTSVPACMASMDRRYLRLAVCTLHKQKNNKGFLGGGKGQTWGSRRGRTRAWRFARCRRRAERAQRVRARARHASALPAQMLHGAAAQAGLAVPPRPASLTPRQTAWRWPPTTPARASQGRRAVPPRGTAGPGRATGKGGEEGG